MKYIKWKIDNSKQLPLAVIEDTPNGYGICELDKLHKNKKAYAKLIAAAPDMLAVCEATLMDILVIREDGATPELLEAMEEQLNKIIKEAT